MTNSYIYTSVRIPVLDVWRLIRTQGQPLYYYELLSMNICEVVLKREYFTIVISLPYASENTFLVLCNGHRQEA